MRKGLENSPNRNNPLFFFDRYKTFLSIAFGLLGFIGTFFTIRFNFDPIRIDIVWSMIFPMMVTFAWGRKYGIISLVFGLNVFYPFYLWPNNGWACFVAFICNIIWIMLHGHASEKRRNSNSIIYNIYFIQLICLLIYTLIGFTLFPLLLRHNPPFWFINAITKISNEIFRIILIKTIVVEFLIVATCDVLLLLPNLKKIFLLKVESKSKHNAKILLHVMGIGVAFFLSAILIEYLLITKDCTCELLKVVQARDVLFLIILMIFCLISSGIAIRYFEKRQESEENNKKITDQLEAIFESTNDLIWSVDREYNIVSYNTSLQDHIKKSYGTDIKKGSSILEILPDERVSKWEISYDKVVSDGKCQFKYLTLKGGRYLEFSLNPIYKNGEIHEISVFGKDFTDRKNAENEIIKLNQELEQRIEDRTIELQSTLSELEAFISAVSHDLKAPLRAIDGYSRIIKEDYEGKLEIECLDIINNIRIISSDMINLIDKLLEYSATSKLSVNKEIIDLKEIFISVFNELLLTCVKRRIQIDFQTGIPFVSADRILIRQVIYNILSNAVKFTKNTSIAIITIECNREGNEYIFSVKDNGAGFEMEYHSKLFGMFQRLHTVEEYEGHGVGLAIVRKIVRKHGGRTWIKGEIGIGAEIYFTIPIE